MGRTVATELITELRALRKGRGIHAPRIDERIGDALRTAFDIDSVDSVADVRRKVGNGLARLAARLPDDLKVSMIAAFALSQETSKPFYQERARLAAEQLKRDERTIRRRIDVGIVQLAELAAADIRSKHDGAGDPSTALWHSETLGTLLHLDQAAPEAFEFRRIVADQDNLSEIDLSVTLTAPVGGAPERAGLAWAFRAE